LANGTMVDSVIVHEKSKAQVVVTEVMLAVIPVVVVVMGPSVRVGSVSLVVMSSVLGMQDWRHEQQS
jgi:hypothetical protein